MSLDTGDVKQVHSTTRSVRCYAGCSMNFVERMDIKCRSSKDGLDLDRLAGQDLGRLSLFQAEAEIQRWESVMFMGTYEVT